MKRRQFLTLTGTFTAGSLLLPDFLHAFGTQPNLAKGDQSVIFIQLFGGNDGLNTFIPIDDPAYFAARPSIAISKTDAVASNKGMAFHPALKNFADMQQEGNLAILQNVGYPEPVRSHFRSQEIWQTAPSSQEYLNTGWLGRYLDLQCAAHNPIAGINLDTIDNLALRGKELNALTVQNPARFRAQSGNAGTNAKLSDNPHLDFVLKVAGSISEGSTEIEAALAKSTAETGYPTTALGKNLEWMGRLIKGNLGSKVYYTSLNGFDTHDNQLAIHKNKLGALNDAIFALYSDLKKARLLDQTTIVIFSEFGRRVHDNGRGTDHGTAAPMFVIGGGNKGKVIGKNPDLLHLDNGDLVYETDFRSVYAALLQQKLSFDAAKIGIGQKPVSGLF